MHVFTHIQKITFCSQLVLKHQQNRKRGFCCHHHCCTIVHVWACQIATPPPLSNSFQKKCLGMKSRVASTIFLKLPKLFLRTQVNCKKEITKSFKEMSTYLYPICYYIRTTKQIAFRVLILPKPNLFLTKMHQFYGCRHYYVVVVHTFYIFFLKQVVVNHILKKPMRRKIYV